MLLQRLPGALLLGLSFLLVACNTNDSSAAHLRHYSKALITLPTGERLVTYLAITSVQRSLGLSQIKNEDFDENSSMLFVFKETAERQFWMPETHFDLDIFFLDEGLRIIDEHRALKHFPHKPGKDVVPHSKKVSARYVLEVKAASSLANKLQLGITLQVSEDN